METNSESWLSLAIQFAIAIGTIGAVVVALFGGWLRDKLTPPKLMIRLKDARGSKTPVTVTDPKDGGQRETDGRWYHVEVANKSRWSPAKEVQVFLLRVEEPDAAEQDQIIWLGDVPMRWRHQEIRPVAPTIGPTIDCDLCSVIKDKSVQLWPLITPHSLNAQRREPCNFTVTLQARSIETDSNLLRVQIAWNGEWSDDTDEMARNMVVKQL